MFVGQLLDLPREHRLLGHVRNLTPSDTVPVLSNPPLP